MIRRSRVLAAALLVTALISATGCSDSDEGEGGKSGAAKDKVTYLTGFGAAGRDAHIWMAKELGYFADAGIDVDIQLGAAASENLGTLASGKAQFAHVDLVGAWILAGKGKFKDFRAIAAIQQQTVVSIITFENSGITSPKDLAGQKIGAATGSVNQLLFPAYAKLAGVDPNSVTWVNTKPPQVAGLLVSGQVKAVSTFLIGKGGIEKAAGGKKTVILPYSDYLSDLYGSGLVTTADIAKNKPDLAKRFREAMFKGLQYTLDHPDEAAALVHKAKPATSTAAAKGEITMMTPYVKSTTGGQPIGALDEQRVARAIAILQGSGLIPAGLTPQDVVDFNLTPKA